MTPTVVPGYCTGRVISITPSTFGSGVFGSGSGAIAVSPGDVVVFESGTDTDVNGDGAVMTITGSGTATQWITFVSRTKWGAKMWGSNNAAAEGISLSGANYVRVEGFEVSDVGNVGNTRGSASGIDLYNGGKNSQIVGNHIHHVGRVCANAGNTNGQVGIYVQTGKNGGNIVVENNLVHDIGRNTFAFCNESKSYTCIVLDAAITNSSIKNNVFYNPSGGKSIEAAGFSGSIKIGTNLTSGNAMHDQGSTPSGMTLVGNLLNTNAQLVDPPSDFRLLSTSPAINKGETLLSVLVDHAGATRPSGLAHDIGAYEFGG